MNYRHFDFGTNEGGVQNIVSIREDGNELVTRDFQSAATIQVILDECAAMRQLHGNGGPPGFGEGYIAAKVPITIWQNWRRAWQEKYRNYFTWQTFEVMKLNSREFEGFKCINGDIHVPKHVAEGGL